MSGRPRRGRVVLGLLAAVAIALGLNVLGILRYPGGPLREPSADGVLWLDIRPADQGSSAVGDAAGYFHPIDVPLQFGVLSVSNASPFNATIEAITPLDPTAGLIVDAVYVMRPDGQRGDVLAWGPTGEYPPTSTVTTSYTTLPATVIPTGETHERDPSVFLIVRSHEPGPIGWSALAIDYRVGPFSFRVVHHLELRGCVGPLPTEAQCGDEEAAEGS